MFEIMKRLLNWLCLFAFFLLAPASASEEHLSLVDGNVQIELFIDDLRQQATEEFTLFAPFRAREIKVRGYLLDTLLKQNFNRVPNRIKLIASDGYETKFENWQPNHWYIVTHEDGQPLSLRQQGPLRLVERDSQRDLSNLNNFNDWVWMLTSIEVMP